MAAGYVLKRSDTQWIARIERTTNDRRRYFSKSFQTENEAKTHLQNQQSTVNLGQFVEPSRLTLAVLMDEWIESISTRVTPRTADGYKGLLDRYVRPLLGPKRVNQIEVRDLQKLYTQIPRAPQFVLVRPDNQVAYVSCDASNQIAVVNISTWKVIS